MSPEIRIDGQLIADVPDETGWHKALNGNPLYVGVDRIDATKDKQLLVLGSRIFGRERIVGLTQDGKGSSANIKKGGDGKQPVIDVVLEDRPIRVSYRDKVRVGYTPTLGGQNRGVYREDKRTYYNPNWMRK